MEELSLPEVHPLPPEGTAAGRTGPSRGHLDGGISDRLTYTSIYQGEHGGIWGRHRPSKRGNGALPKGKTAMGSSRTEARGATKKKGRGPKTFCRGQKSRGLQKEGVRTLRCPPRPLFSPKH